MKDINALFKNRKMQVDRLRSFGFCESEESYTYSTSLLDDQFEMIVTITKEGKVSAKVIDKSSKEDYVLHHLSYAQGAFVGAVRMEYEAVLSAIATACFAPDVFQSEEAKRILQYVREKYQDEAQFLWQRFPNNAIFRRQDNAKWYAALLIVQKKKLGLDEDGELEIIDLRTKPEHRDVLLDGKGYFPGYHMNKKHWITICLDGSVAVEEIFCRIDESFALAAKG